MPRIGERGLVLGRFTYGRDALQLEVAELLKNLPDPYPFMDIFWTYGRKRQIFRILCLGVSYEEWLDRRENQNQ